MICMEFESLDLCPPCLWTTASYGRMVACVFGTSIRLYSENKIFRTLRGHCAKIIALSVDPVNHMQLISCDVNGKLFSWDIINGKYVAEMEIPISGLIFAQFSSDSLVIVKVEGANKSNQANASITCYTLAKGTKDMIDVDRPLVSFTSPVSSKLGAKAFSIGMEGRLIAISGLSSIEIHSLLENGVKSRVSIEGSNLVRKAFITAVALHPLEGEVAAGLSSGEVCIWRFPKPQHGGISSTTGKKASRKRHRDGSLHDSGVGQRRLHWHALAVKCLSYNASGTFLFSGGHEAVLVQWDLTDGGASSARRKLLPRLRSPVQSVGSLAPDCVFVLLTNRTLLLLRPGTGLELTQEIHGRLLRGIPVLKDHNQCPWHSPSINLDPKLNSVVFGTRPGHLQWTKEGIAGNELDVTNENYVALAPPRDDLWRDPVSSCSTEVVRVAFSETGDILATWETLVLGESKRQVRRLKWWKRGKDDSDVDWSLMQCSNVSHLGDCMDLTFAETNELAVATRHGKISLFAETKGYWEELAEWQAGTAWSISICFQPSGRSLAAGCANQMTVFDWKRSRPFHPKPTWSGKVDAGWLKQVAWTPAGDAVIGRTDAGTVWRWVEGEPGSRLITADITSIAVPRSSIRGTKLPWVAAMTLDQRCLLLDVSSGEMIRSIEVGFPVCCSVVTADAILYALSSSTEDGFIRIRLEGEDEKADSVVDSVEILEIPSLMENGLMKKLEVLARGSSQEVSKRPSEQERRRLSELAATRIKGHLDELIHCSAFCCPDLERLASSLLELHMEMEVK